VLTAPAEWNNVRIHQWTITGISVLLFKQQAQPQSKCFSKPDFSQFPSVPVSVGPVVATGCHTKEL
jgi:hypothetical protein